MQQSKKKQIESGIDERLKAKMMGVDLETYRKLKKMAGEVSPKVTGLGIHGKLKMKHRFILKRKDGTTEEWGGS